MLYVLAWLVPPLALLLIGRPFAAIINGIWYVIATIIAIFTFGFGLPLVLPCIIHACAAVGGRNADKRIDRLGDRFERAQRAQQN